MLSDKFVDTVIASSYHMVHHIHGYSLMSRIRSSHAKAASNARTTCDVLGLSRFLDVSGFSKDSGKQDAVWITSWYT